jgi:hypothetical protein
LILELYDLPDAIGVYNLQACQSSSPVVHVDFARLVDHVIESIERDLQDIVPRIVGDAKQRHPFRLYLVAQIEGGDLDLRHIRLKKLGDDVKKRTPFRLFESSDCYGRSLFGYPRARLLQTLLDALEPVLFSNQPIHAPKREDRGIEGKKLLSVR